MYVIDTRIKRRALRNWLVLQSVSHGSDNLVSYFEIGGHVHECEVYGPASVERTSLGSISMKEIAREFPGKMMSSKSASADKKSYTEMGLDVLKENQKSRRQKLGATLMRWSVGGALVPDPLPLVDEVLFGTTFVIGAVLYASD